MIASKAATSWRNLVGVVLPDTNLVSLIFEVVAEGSGIEEGRLVETAIRGQRVLFQVVEGASKEELLLQKNSYGYARAKARKIGRWNASTGRFESVGWIPLVNEPVFLVEEGEASFAPEAIGQFPGTDYPVRLSVKELVTHNAAILGILGTGKTMLAMELVERMMAENVRVICLDITGEYASLLPLDGSDLEVSQRLANLQAVGAAGRTNFQRNKQEGGSVTSFRDQLREQLQAFLNAEGSGQLLIFDPSDFEVWQQDTQMYQNAAGMSSLTPAEITRIVAELILGEVQSQGVTDQPRVCLVLEEAHSLVPEWNSVATEGDRTAVNGTARAILQGRKYGLGC